MPRRAVSLLLLLLLAAPAAAQDGLRAPADFLGYPLGERFTPHHRVVDYVRHVAEHSPYVRLEPYGETYEGRPLLVAYVATPERLGRLDDVRLDHLRRIGLAEGAAADPDEAPAVVWLSYNVHGNESVSTEAALETLHRLAAPDERARGWLEDAVVVLDPAINPDGRDRYVSWYNRTVGRFPNAHPDAREHHEPWPGGRTNHYYFDLNRDWAWGVQQESRQRIALYNRWLPHVHVDFHEQGVDAPYYFAPAAEPYHDAITDWQRDFQTAIGENHAGYFDDEGWLYFTRQVFDLLYPSYGDTWPTFNGAVGMTYEQGGSGRAGLAIRTAEGDTLTLADRIAHHVTTGLSTVETAARDRGAVVQAAVDYFETARTAPEGRYKTYVVRSEGAGDQVRALTDLLDAQGIRYGWAPRARTARGVDYATGETGEVRISPGDLVVSAYQPKSVLARVLFEPETALADSVTYDITAWALPYAYGVQAYALTERLPADGAPPAPAPTPPDVARPYAYLLPWTSPDDARFLADILREGVKLRYAERPFEIDGRRFGRGTLIVTRRGNERMGTGFDEAVRAAARAHGRTLTPVASGLVASGADFGSGDVPFLARPRIAVISGENVSSYGLGEVWHYFDEQIGYPVTLIDGGDVGGVDWSDYDVVVLPGGRYGDVFGGERMDALRSWVRGGGRIVALEGAASFLAGQDGFGLDEKARDDGEDADSLDARLRPFADRERAAISDAVPGAVFRVRLDATHPLGFGFDDGYYTLKRGDDAFTFLEDGWNVGVVRAGDHRSGFVGAEARERLEDTLVFGVEDVGRGSVVYLVDNPLFRGFWYDGRLLFANAVFMVGQ